MANWTHRYKPAAAARTHLLMAALMWSLVGTGLLIVGTWWSRTQAPARLAVLLAIAAFIGLLKARFVLRKSAIRIASRIRARGDGRCLGGFISWRTWIMVGIMMGLGRLLRGGLLARPVVAFIYEAVGVALLAASFELWRHFRSEPTPASPPEAAA